MNTNEGNNLESNSNIAIAIFSEGIDYEMNSIEESLQDSIKEALAGGAWRYKGKNIGERRREILNRSKRWKQIEYLVVYLFYVDSPENTQKYGFYQVSFQNNEVKVSQVNEFNASSQIAGFELKIIDKFFKDENFSTTLYDNVISVHLIENFE